MNFNSPIDKSKDNYLFLDKSSDTLIISFASFYNKGQERYDWNILRKYNTDILFIRDLSMKWYLCGLEGTSTDVKSTLLFIKGYTDRYKKVYCIGSSMGGYGALLYGSLIEDTTIIVFGPQVDISSENKRINPWTKKSLTEDGGVYDTISLDDRLYLDLHNSVRFSLDTTVHYSKNHEYDSYNASLIGRKKVGYDTECHAIARYLNTEGKLKSLMNRIFNEWYP